MSILSSVACSLYAWDNAHSNPKCPSEPFVLEEVVEQNRPDNTSERRSRDSETQSDTTTFLKRKGHAHQARREEKAVSEADEKTLR